MVLLATAIKQFYFIFNMSLLILLSLVIFLSKRDFITIFFKSFDFSVDFFAFSTKICLFLSFPQMVMALLKSNSESSGPCIETIIIDIKPCNMVLVSLFVPQCCLHSRHTTESPFTFNTHSTNEPYNYVIRSGTWILACSFSQFFFYLHIYQLRIGTKSVFEFHNYRSVLFHGI